MTARAPRDPARPPPRPRAGAGAGPCGPAGRRPGPRRPPERDAGAEQLHRLAAGFVQAFLEVECGLRPRDQLIPVLCPLLADRLFPVWVRQGALGRVVRIYGVRVTPRRYEAVVLVRRGPRVGALVVALARSDRGWRVVDAARCEDAATATRPVRPPRAPAPIGGPEARILAAGPPAR
ncbi:MAG: Rv3235 family protein [Egibacteraceae bacterium]